MIEYKYLKNPNQLSLLLDKFAQAKFLSIDTEFMRRKTFFVQPSLLQIRLDDLNLLIDLISIKDKKLIKQILTVGDSIKIIHSASEDLQVFFKIDKIKIKNFFDTQIMANWLLPTANFKANLSYAKLVEISKNIVLAKTETTSDWLKRPLSKNQLMYAAEDIEYLKNVYDFLLEQPKTQKRISFGNIDYSFLQVVEIESQHTANQVKNAHNYSQDYRFFDKAVDFCAEELANLAAIVDWRLEVAKQADLPLKWVLGNEQVLNLAKKKNLAKKIFAEADRLNYGLVKKYSKKLSDLIVAKNSDLTNFQPVISKKEPKFKDLNNRWKKNIQEFETDFDLPQGTIVSSRTIFLLLQDYLQTGKMPKSYSIPEWRLKAIKHCFPIVKGKDSL